MPRNTNDEELASSAGQPRGLSRPGLQWVLPLVQYDHLPSLRSCELQTHFTRVLQVTSCGALSHVSVLRIIALLLRWCKSIIT